MDASIISIADYASTLTYADLLAQVVHEYKRHIHRYGRLAIGASRMG